MGPDQEGECGRHPGVVRAPDAGGGGAHHLQAGLQDREGQPGPRGQGQAAPAVQRGGRVVFPRLQTVNNICSGMKEYLKVFFKKIEKKIAKVKKKKIEEL